MMKHSLLITIAALLGSHVTNAQEQVLFSSDFAPTEAQPHVEFDVVVPQWSTEGGGQQNTRRWVHYPDVDAFSLPPVNSNGFFGELFRFTDNTDNGWWMTPRLSIGAGMDYTVTLDFKATTDDGFVNNGQLAGEARLFVRYWQDQFFWLGQTNQDLIIGSSVIGEEAFAGAGQFASVVVGEADANGWRTITINGTTPENTVLIDLWVLAENGDDNRFFGSFGIDNVEVVSNSAEFQTVVESSTGPAIDIEFTTEPDQYYLVQTSADLMGWNASGDLLTGAGETVQRFISTRGKDREFIRVVTE